MLILGLDFETSGLDSDKDRVLEIGLALWDVESHRAVKQTDFFVQPDIVIPDQAWQELTPIHGITKELVAKFGIMDQEALEQLNGFALAADAIVAHNGTLFDKLFHESWNKRYGISDFSPTWIDTRLDIPEPMTGPLITLCAKKGFLNPFPHQALSDVLSMLRLLDEYDLPAVVARARIPNIYVEAIVSFDDKELAKERGHFWNGYDGPSKQLVPTKQWLKLIKECDLEKEKAEAPFRVRPTKVRYKKPSI